MDSEKKKAKPELNPQLKSELKPELKSELKSPHNPSWNHIESDLKHALDTWSDLTQELANKISPEEEQLREIKTLLGTLRDKLKEFSEDDTGLLGKDSSGSEKPPETEK